MHKLQKYFVLFVFLFHSAWVLPLVGELEGVASGSCLSAQDILSDSLSGGEEKVDSSQYTRRNIAKDFNYLDHVLDGRYMPYGDQFTKRWDDHLFIEVGAGLQQVVAPSDTYEFTPITNANIAIGKQFSPKHSLRLTLNAGYAYQKEQEYFMYQLGAKLDHIFDMSSYFAGYDPTRRLSVSTVVGLGAVRSTFAHNSDIRDHESAMAFEGHLGLQFKIFTGPQGYINIEPYAGLGTDPLDISGKRNWRDYDAFYGAKLSYVYYLHNNLSPEARAEYLVKRILKDELTADSTLFSWRKPLFIEFSNSMNFLKTPELSMGATKGGGYSLSLGGWLSPAIALRGTVSNENVVYTHASKFNNAEKDALSGNYLGARAEALLNPFGFVRHYNWDSRFGVYAVAGLQVGKLWKRGYGESVNAYYQGYTAGLHLWTRLSDGLQLFVEPRYEYIEYHKPNHDRMTNWRYSDDLWGVNVGVTVFTRTRKYIDWKVWEERDQSQFMNKIAIGVGGGFNFMQKNFQYANTNLKLGYNLGGFAEYHFNATHAARLSAEGTVHRLAFYRFGDLEESHYGAAYLSLDYMLNLTNILNSQDPDLRTFEAFVFGGPTAMSRVSSEGLGKVYYTGNLGMKLLYHVNRHIGVHLTPTFYYLHKGIKKHIYDPQNFSSMSVMETLNAGVQYTF